MSDNTKIEGRKINFFIGLMAGAFLSAVALSLVLAHVVTKKNDEYRWLSSIAAAQAEKLNQESPVPSDCPMGLIYNPCQTMCKKPE